MPGARFVTRVLPASLPQSPAGGGALLERHELLRLLAHLCLGGDPARPPPHTVGRKGAAERARIDPLFIDEGFGSLDSETLESLHAGGRQVGIISHVSGLAERLGDRGRA